MPRSATERPSETPEAAKEPAAKANGATGEATSADWNARCANCGAGLHGRYCYQCGEKVIGPDDYALGGFLRRALSTLTHLDGSVFRTYYYLVARPGFLTQEHRAGRRKRYLKPLQVFILVNVAYFFFVTWTGSMTFLRPSLAAQLNGEFYSGVATRLVEEHLQQSGLTMGAYATRFDALTTRLSKTLIITMIPALALLAKLVSIRRRRYYVEHLVFGCHFYAFFLVLQMAFLPILIALFAPAFALSAEWGAYMKNVVGNGPGFVLLFLTAIGTYLYLTLRRRYDQPAWSALLKSVLLSAGVILIMQLYSALLFFTAFYATT